MADHSASQPSAAGGTCVEDGNKTSADAAMDAAGKKAQEDPELNDLLNSALQDFDKVKQGATPETPAPPTTATSPPSDAGAAAGGKPEGATADPMSAEFSEMFSQQLASQFEETMASLMTQNPECMQQFEKLVQAADTAGDSQEAQQNFMQTLAQTLSEMSVNADRIETEVGEGEDQADEQTAEILPIMQEMMQTLLSKTVLYPSLKEIASKYPAYLSENEGKLEASDLDLYRKQYELMTAICSLYEEDEDKDTPEEKAQRFEKLLDLMQEMQKLGQPPKEIVGEMAPGLEFDENGMPKLPGMDSSQCALM